MTEQQIHIMDMGIKCHHEGDEIWDINGVVKIKNEATVPMPIKVSMVFRYEDDDTLAFQIDGRYVMDSHDEKWVGLSGKIMSPVVWNHEKHETYTVTTYVEDILRMHQDTREDVVGIMEGRIIHDQAGQAIEVNQRVLQIKAVKLNQTEPYITDESICRSRLTAFKSHHVNTIVIDYNKLDDGLLQALMIYGFYVLVLFEDVVEEMDRRMLVWPNIIGYALVEGTSQHDVYEWKERMTQAGLYGDWIVGIKEESIYDESYLDTTYTYAVRQAFQDIRFICTDKKEVEDVFIATIMITNDSMTIGTDAFLFAYEVIEDGVVIEREVMDDIVIEPGENHSLIISINRNQWQDEASYHLNILATLKEDTAVESAGYIVAREQISLRERVAPYEGLHSDEPVQLVDKKIKVVALSNEMEVSVNKSTSECNSLAYNGQEVFLRPLTLVDWNSHDVLKGKVTQGVVDKDIHVKTMTNKLRIKNHKSAAEWQYQWDGDSNMDIQISIEPSLPPEGVALSTALRRNWKFFSYYGEGPEDGLKVGAGYMGIYDEELDKRHVIKTGVKWCLIEDENRDGIMIESRQLEGMRIEIEPEEEMNRLIIKASSIESDRLNIRVSKA